DNDANDGDFSDVDIIGVADLSIVKSAEQAGAPGSDCAVYADENILYTLTVTNSGPSTAQNVVVTDVLPGGTTLVASNPGGTLDGGVLTVPLGDMAPLAQAVVTIEVTVPPAGGLLVNTASVQSLVTQDLDLADNASNAVGCPV